MHDLSQFCKTFKETYTQDYNRRHDNTGTIWEGRFKSILLEGSWKTLMTVAGYIHLNPVRAEMVAQPEQATNAGYGAACQGDTRAMTGLVSLAKKVYGAKETTWAQSRAVFAEMLTRDDRPVAVSGLRFSASAAHGATGDPESLSSLRELLRRRVAGFLHGGALGEERFLKRAGRWLPKRIRRRSKCSLDGVSGFGLAPAGGVRERSRGAS